jgi:PAS domain-containing protein
MKKETNITKKEVDEAAVKKERKKLFFWIALFILLVSATVWLNSQQRITYIAPSAEERFGKVLVEFSGKWKEEMELLQKDLEKIVDQKMREMQRLVLNYHNFDAFCDEYYGYFKGLKFMWLGAKDLFSSKESHVDREVQSMVERHFLGGIEGRMYELYLEIEAVTEKRVAHWQQDFQKALRANFDEAEIERLVKDFKVTPDMGVHVSVAGSLVRITADIVGGKIGSALFSKRVTKMSQKIAAQVVAKLFSKTAISTGMTVAGSTGTFAAAGSFAGPVGFFVGLTVGIITDAILSAVIRGSSEGDLRRGLRISLERYLNSMKRQLIQNINSSLRSIAAQGPQLQ